MIKFTVVGEPTGKGRPQFSTYGGRVTARTPEKTKRYEEYVLLCWKVQSGVKYPKETPLKAIIKGHFAIPKSVAKKRRNDYIGKPYTHKCDADNLAKSILDALSGTAFYDDSQVCELVVTKDYAEEASVEVLICEGD